LSLVFTSMGCGVFGC